MGKYDMGKYRRILRSMEFLLILAVPLNYVSGRAQAATEADVTRATLKNGLRVVIVRNTLAPVVTTEINYLVGSNEAPDGFPGMAHALEHMIYSRLLSVIFAGPPYAHDALGPRSPFQKTTGKMLKDFHKNWYAPNNAILIVVGDVDPAAALAKIKRFFEPIPRRAVPVRPKIQL